MAEKLESEHKTSLLRILPFAFVRLFASMVFSTQAPFYPVEAEKKGLSTLEYGLVFGIYELFSILFTPVLDRLVKVFPGRTVFLLSTLTLGASTAAFGLLDRVYGHWEFLSLSILFRGVEATGMTGTAILSLAAVYQELPTRMATASALMEICSGTGMSLGPLVGGFFFQIGGFMLPFLVVGISVCLTGIIGTCALRPVPTDSEDLSTNKKSLTLLSAIKIPSVLLGASALFMGALCISGIITILEPYVRTLQLTPVEVSLMFVAYTGSYTIFGLAWGVLCDRIEKPSRVNIVTVFGLVVAGLGFSCSEPVSSLLAKPVLRQWAVSLGLVLNGTGISAVSISAIVQITAGIKQEHPGNKLIYTTVSGLISLSVCLGAAVGPVVAGACVDFLGFPSYYYFCLAVNVLLIMPYVYLMAASETKVVPKWSEESSALID